MRLGSHAVSSKIVFLISMLLTSAHAFAEVPVVDAYQQQHASQQIKRAASVNMVLKLAAQIRAMRDDIQALRGRVDVLTHRLQQAESAQHRQYEDLDKRLGLAVHHPAQRVTGAVPSSSAQGTVVTAQPENPAMQSSMVLDEARIKEQRAYRVAYNLMRDRRFGAAMVALNKFLQLYPKGHYAPNAHYWLGELNLIAGQSKAASAEFTLVATQFPKHDKASDALLKMGVIAVDNAKWVTAKRYFKQVKQTYPKTSAAQLAQAKLLMLQKQGH